MTAWFRALVAVMLFALATAGNAAAQPVSSSKTLKAWANWPYQSYCGGEAISPVPLFSSPAGAENGARPAEVGLREVIYNPEIAWIGLATQGYRLLDEDADSASFVSGGLNEGPRYLSLRRVDGQWKFGGSGPCFLNTVIVGAETVTWSLVSNLRPNTKQVRVQLGPGGCNDGASQNERARKPIFRQMGRRLLMLITLDPISPGPHLCPGSNDPPLTVRLPSRLAGLKLYDGGSFPPRSAAET